jgi:hypothetical protein
MVKIVGFNLSKVSAEKYGDVKGKIEIKSNLQVTEIAQEKLELAKDNHILSFTFEYNIIYEPKTADILFKGEILMMLPINDAKEILKKWKKKEIADNIRIILFNTMLAKCNVRALELEEELNIPTHIPMPKLSPPQAGKSYTG